MQIKDVEKQTGLTAKSIRLYEEKGLLEIERNKNNAYREYSEENVAVLKQIKLLRYLEFSVLEIRELINASNEEIVAALDKKEKEYQTKIDDFSKKSDICNLLKKDCVKSENIRKVFGEYEEIVPDLELTLDFIQDYNNNSLFEMILYSLMCLGPILWLFVNWIDKKWSELSYNIPFALGATVILTLQWSKYFRNIQINREKMKKKNSYTILKVIGIIGILVLSFGIFAIIEKTQILLFAPKGWLFYSVHNKMAYLIIILVEAPLIIGFFKLFREKNEMEEESLEESLEEPKLKFKSWKIALVSIWCFLLYIYFSNITFVTEDAIICHNWLHPKGVMYSYSDISLVKAGFGEKQFTIDDSTKKGSFYYRVILKGKEMNFSDTYPNNAIDRYEDTYLELEEFDQTIMKYGARKISSEAGSKNCDFKDEYVQIYLRIINNK